GGLAGARAAGSFAGRRGTPSGQYRSGARGRGGRPVSHRESEIQTRVDQGGKRSVAEEMGEMGRGGDVLRGETGGTERSAATFQEPAETPRQRPRFGGRRER